MRLSESMRVQFYIQPTFIMEFERPILIESGAAARAHRARNIEPRGQSALGCR